MAWSFRGNPIPAPSTYLGNRSQVISTRRAIDGTLRTDRMAAGTILDHVLQYEAIPLSGWDLIKTAYDSGQNGVLITDAPAAGTFDVYMATLAEPKRVGDYVLNLRLSFQGSAPI